MYLERVLLRSNQVNSKGGLVCFVLTVANSLTKKVSEIVYLEKILLLCYNLLSN